MSYRSLLVFLDQDALCVARTHSAFQLAMALDCHHVDVAPTGLVDPLSEFAAKAQADLRDQAVETTGIDIAHAMLSKATKLKVALIVMDAYGQVRWIERLLCSTTRGVLATMTLPVLMSH